MIARHTFTYLGSRGLAAALNMASVAVFTRLAPAESFGAYLLLLSWSLLLYSATSQWPKFAFFALYDEARAAAQVATVLRLLGVMVLLSGLVCAAASALGLVSAPVAAAILASGAGMALFEAAVEIGRTRLAVNAVAASVVSRAILVLGLGSAAILMSHRAVDLLLATALANALAALPALAAIAPLLRGRASADEMRRILIYGWPLILSFTAAALAQTVDRLIVGNVLGVRELGAYGAVSDFLRQSFVVFGEAIALAIVSIAKRDARAGGIAAARPALADAMRLMALVAAFGAVFVLTFKGFIISTLLGPDYRDTALSIAPLLLVASILVMFRAYYFGQVIYFSPTSRLEALASLATLATVAALSAVLIPSHGVAGAAFATMLGQGVACLVLALGAREDVRLPIPWADLGIITLAALASRVLILSIDALSLGSAGIALDLMLIMLGAGGVAWHLNLIGVADLARRRLGAGLVTMRLDQASGPTQRVGDLVVALRPLDAGAPWLEAWHALAAAPAFDNLFYHPDFALPAAGPFGAGVRVMLVGDRPPEEPCLRLLALWPIRVTRARWGLRLALGWMHPSAFSACRSSIRPSPSAPGPPCSRAFAASATGARC